jgi:hypothetical protein
MKKIVFVAIALLFAFQASAQFSVGVLAGTVFPTAKLAEVSADDPVKFYGGVTCNFDLPLGFSIQPAVNFVSKDAYFREDLVVETQIIELPVSFQWGPDLLVFRPFVDVTPFAGFRLGTNIEKFLPDGTGIRSSIRNVDKKFEYGIGVGGGIDIWKLRLTARYNWNLGPLLKDGRFPEGAAFEFPDDNYKGLTLSLSFFFL